MKKLLYTFSSVSLILLMSFESNVQEFQGQAYYFSKTPMELGSWGARMSEAEKKQTQERLKNRLEKTYILNFNREEAVFVEEEKVDAISGATDSWGSNFTRGKQYKNVKENNLIQSQEFYGKRFLVKDKLYPIEWVTGKETKKIGQYLCFKATASVPTNELSWYDFSWGDLAAPKPEGDAPAVKLTNIEAWYTLQIPVSNGPAEYWGLPGLILEVNTGTTTILCSKIILNPKEKVEILAPDKGQEITKKAYQATIQQKMLEMRNNTGRRN
jgi:GLPGLI family protein